MGSIKSQMKKIIEDQLDDASYSEILKELALGARVERGLGDVEKNNVISNEEIEPRIGFKKRGF